MVVAFKVFLLAVGRLSQVDDVGLKMANVGVEMFFVMDMISTMYEDLRFTDQEPRRVLTAYALYTDLMFEIKVVGSSASVTFTRNVKPALGNKDRDPLVKELSSMKFSKVSGC